MKRMMCLILSAAMTFLTPALTVFAKPVWPEDTGIESESGIVMDMDSGAVLYGQGIHIRKAPASITKLVTALVVIENSDDLSEMVTFSKDAVYNVEEGSGNKFALDEGDVLSVEDCLYVLLLQSSNQASNALAEHVAGSRDAFVEMMNAKVAEMGLENTKFANPSGLNDTEQYTSAYDMALIAKEAYSSPKLLEINSAKSHKLPPTKNNPNGATYPMEHKLVVTTSQSSETYFPSAVAGKTGYTSIAGQTLVTYAVKDNKRLIAVTLKSKAVTHYKDTIALLNFGFDRFENLNVAEAETAAAGGGPITVEGYDSADLSIDPGAVITVPRGAVYTDLTRKQETKLPKDHPKGAVAHLTYLYGSERKVGDTYIISASKALEEETAIAASVTESAALPSDGAPSLPAEGEKGFKLPKFSFSVPAKGVLTAIGILVLAVIVCMGIISRRKKKEQERLVMEERKRRRRQRLKEMGCSEDEFRQMLDKRNGGDGRSDNGR